MLVLVYELVTTAHSFEAFHRRRFIQLDSKDISIFFTSSKRLYFYNTRETMLASSFTSSSKEEEEEEATTQKKEEASKEENTTTNTTTAQQKRIDAPSFIFAVVVFCLVMFSVVFGAFVKVPTRRSTYDRTQKITSAHDVHFAHAHHLHHHNNHRDDDDDDEEEEQGV